MKLKKISYHRTQKIIHVLIRSAFHGQTGARFIRGRIFTENRGTRRECLFPYPSLRSFIPRD